MFVVRWYKNESSKLAQTYEFQKREIEKLKSKYNLLDDNKFLKDQAKGCKRQNNILKHALDKNKELLNTVHIYLTFSYLKLTYFSRSQENLFLTIYLNQKSPE